MSENDEKYTIFYYLSFINCKNIVSVRKTLSLQIKNISYESRLNKIY